jgi:hypothetical protein
VEQYPGVAVFEDYVALLDSGMVEAVVTTVPLYLHPQMGIQALERESQVEELAHHPRQVRHAGGVDAHCMDIAANGIGREASLNCRFGNGIREAATAVAHLSNDAARLCGKCCRQNLAVADRVVPRTAARMRQYVAGTQQVEQVRQISRNATDVDHDAGSSAAAGAAVMARFSGSSPFSPTILAL